MAQLPRNLVAFSGFANGASEKQDGPHTHARRAESEDSHRPLGVGVPPPVVGLLLYVLGSAFCWLLIGLALGLFKDTKKTRKNRATNNNR